MILIELLFGMMLAAFVLLMLPFFLVMAGNAGVLFLWIVAAFAFATMLCSGWSSPTASGSPFSSLRC